MTHTRRELLTAAGAGAAAGLVWTAPRIEGLSLRPRYASAMSANCVSFSFTVAISNTSSSGVVSFKGDTAFSASNAGDPAQLFFEIHWNPASGGKWEATQTTASSLSNGPCTVPVGPNGIPNPTGTQAPSSFIITGEMCCP